MSAGTEPAKRPLDLNQYTDEQIVRVVAQETPQLIEILGAAIDRGLSDEAIVRFACESGGSGQAMRYIKKCLGPMRRFRATGSMHPTPAPDAKRAIEAP